MFNKCDAADPEMLVRLRRLAPGAAFVSARTGHGLDTLRELVEAQLPRPAVELRVLLPYTRGDLVARLHGTAEVLSSEHTEDGTRLHARVSPDLAASLTPYLDAAGTAR